MPTIALFTYKDLLDHLVGYIGDNSSKDALRDCRAAAQDGYRDLASAHEWSYYWQRGRLNTVASYNTGTVAYDHTGGTYERMLTLSSGTWPSWAAFGQVMIANVVYQVAERKSDSIITLTYQSNPGADVASGTSYTIFRDSYPLPADFLAADELINASNSLGMNYTHPRDWMARQRVYQSPAAPFLYTFTSDENYFGAMAVRFFPPPDAAYPIDFVYRRRPRPLVIDEYKTGTVSVSASSSTVTGSGTVWTSSMAGSVLRLSSSTTDGPTGLRGANPYVVERVVASVESATSLTVDSAIDTAYTAVKYAISDPVDVEDGVMLTALLRCCERQSTLTRIMKNADMATAAYREALLTAREGDRRSTAPRSAACNTGWFPRLRDYPRGSDVS